MVIAFLSIGVLPRASGAPFSYLHPRVDLGVGWKSSLVVVNIGENATSVTLFAHDVKRNLLGEIRGASALTPGDRRVYFSEDRVWPEGTASLSVQSDSPLLSLVIVESTDGKALGFVLAAIRPMSVLTFLLIRPGQPWWTQLVLQNSGLTTARLELIAPHQDAPPLASGSLPSFPSIAHTAPVTSDLAAHSPRRMTGTPRQRLSQHLVSLLDPSRLKEFGPAQMTEHGDLYATGHRRETQSASQAQRIWIAVESVLASQPPEGYRPIPHGVRLLDVKVEGNRVTLNFSKELLSKGTGSVLEDALHQILSPLSDVVPEIKNGEYRILVDGVPLDKYFNE